ncbi:UDP-N-acetylglucosamine 4,6-dehydratase (inverting) [Gammaproteobacteria bacterium]
MSLKNKTILVTGGTGSFGQQFIQTLLKNHNPRRVIVFSRDELKQHDLRARITDSRLQFFIGDIRDRDRLYRAFRAGVDVVVHAAALKQVPSCEYNPFEAVKTNIIGAQNIIDAAIDCEVPKVLALSTDKAVSPANLYGATKLCMEKLFVHGNSYAGARATAFSCVRYGNVVGSRGSVIPLFLEQRATGRVTVTDARMTRFWITLEQGVDFVIRCIARMQRGEIFVPRLPSMNIMDLVAAVVPNCAVEHTGIRPGEKLHETLISVDEARHTRALDDLFIIEPESSFQDPKNTPVGYYLPEDFCYSSDKNDRWLTIEQLQTMIHETEHLHFN